MVRIHRLKVWLPQFEALWLGLKTFEIRKNDRDYRAGDVLHLCEWQHEKAEEDQGAGESYSWRWTGRSITAQVPYVLIGGAPPTEWLPSDLALMALRELSRAHVVSGGGGDAAASYLSRIESTLRRRFGE